MQGRLRVFYDILVKKNYGNVVIKIYLFFFQYASKCVNTVKPLTGFTENEFENFSHSSAEHALSLTDPEDN